MRRMKITRSYAATLAARANETRAIFNETNFDWSLSRREHSEIASNDEHYAVRTGSTGA